MGVLTLRLLGAPAAFRDGRALAFRTRKTLALLAYLAVEGGQHSREKLTALLWPDSTAALARASLRNTLTYLHNALRAPDAPAYILAQGDALGFDPAAPLDLDLRALTLAGDDVALEAALAAYRGEFLEGFTLPDAPEFDDWIVARRAALGRDLAAIYDRLAALRLDRGDAAGAANVAARWAAHDPLSEVAARRLMQAQFAAGDHGAALRAYEALRSALAAELGVQPAPETAALARRIREAATQGSASARPAAERRQGPGWVAGHLVGRGAEFAALTAAFGAAAAGAAQAALIEGEAGIGKTRLAEEFLRWAAAAGADILAGRSFEAGGRVAYAPLVAALRPRLERENAPDDLLGDVWLAELARLLPELRERYPDLPPAAPGDTARSTLFEGVARLIAALAERAPVVLFVDDVQWADADTLDLLHYGARRWAELGAAVLLLMTLRGEERGATPGLDRRLRELARAMPLRHLTPGRLDPSETLLLLDTFSLPAPGSAARVALAEWLYQETGGQPFYLVETLKALRESGLLATGRLPDGSRAIDVAASRLDAAALAGFLPASVQEVIRARLARLSPPAFGLVTAAAVLGDEAPFELLRVVAGLDEASGLAALDELLAAQLLREAAGGDRYSFSHDKIRSVSYSEAGGARRRLFHRRAFDTLAPTASPAELVRHALGANMPAAVLRSSLDAGFAAMRLFAIQSAIEHFERARRLLEAPGADQALSPADLEGLYAQLGRAYQFAGEHEQAGRAFTRMLEVARAAGLAAMESAALNRLATHAAQDFNDVERPRLLLDEARKAAERSGEPVVLAEAEWTTAQLSFYRSDVATTMAHAARALALARRSGAGELIARSLNIMSYGESESYQWAASAEHAEAALAIYHGLNDRAMEVDCLSLLAKARLAQGQPRAALDIAARGVALGRDAANPWGEANCSIQLAFALLDLGDFEAALLLSQETREIARRAAAHPVYGLSLIVIGKALRLLGSAGEAAASHREALEFISNVPTQPFKVIVCAELCADCTAASDWSAAREWALQAEAADERTLHYLNGLAFWEQLRALLPHDAALAADALRRAAERAANGRRYELPYLRACAEYDYWQGDLAAAARHLEAATALAQEIGLPGELWSARARLAEIYRELGRADLAADLTGSNEADLAALAKRISDPGRRAAFLQARSAASEPV